MGFVDIIGTAINYVKIDFTLSDTMANVLSLSCFLWFLVLSIPTGLLLNRIGRKNTVLISFIFTFAGLVLPFFAYNFPVIIVAFVLIGIGNTIIQVAINPLLTNVVSKEKLTSSLTMGHFMKALASWLGPNVAAWLAATTFGWKYAFPVFALITLLSAIWLWATHISETKVENRATTFSVSFVLLKDKKILLFFIGILVLVGVDVGLNTTLPKYLLEKCPSDIAGISQADQLKSYFYFIVRALGTFFGSILLMRVSERKFYVFSALLVLAGLITILFADSLQGILASIIAIALGYSNLFAIIIVLAIKHIPGKANEVSSLLIMGIAGGIFALLLGMASDAFGTQRAAMALIAIMWIYIVWLIRPILRWK
jgi:fucose permease